MGSIDSHADSSIMNAVSPILDRFLSRARDHADSVALVDGEGQLTYKELRQLVGALALWIDRRVPPEESVFILGARTRYLVIALLATWEAKRVAVMADAHHPDSHLRNLIKTTKAYAAIDCRGPDSVHDVLGVLPEAYLRLEGKIFPVSASDGESCCRGSDADAGYICFTSGTTGRPLGIRGSCAPISHFIGWYIRTFQPSCTSRYAMLSGLGHDPIFRDIMIPLSIGGCLFIPPDGRYFIDALPMFLRENKISHVHLTPSLLTSLRIGKTVCPELRAVFFAGEPLSSKHVSSARIVAPNAQLFNFYGTTETPQAMAYYQVPEEGPDLSSGIIPIGHAIDGVTLMILADEGTNCAPCEIGEICVCTQYLTEGYVEEPALMLSRYGTVAGHKGQGLRIFRTGDFGFVDTEGVFFCQGRRDRQVKIRGHRVELNEIERHLRSHRSILDAVVLAEASEANGIELDAYIVGSESDLTAETVAGYVKEALPSYMVPRRVLLVPAIPLTINGKRDISALIGVAPSAPVTETLSRTEETLLDIFQEVLTITQIGIDDDFLDIGCHSLLLQRVANRIQGALRIDIGLRMLFEFPTIRSLAGAIELEFDAPDQYFL